MHSSDVYCEATTGWQTSIEGVLSKYQADVVDNTADIRSEEEYWGALIEEKEKTLALLEIKVDTQKTEFDRVAKNEQQVKVLWKLYLELKVLVIHLHGSLHRHQAEAKHAISAYKKSRHEVQDFLTDITGFSVTQEQHDWMQESQEITECFGCKNDVSGSTQPDDANKKSGHELQNFLNDFAGFNDTQETHAGMQDLQANTEIFEV